MSSPDWPRIEHLLKVGIFAAVLVLIGDMLLGWGTSDPNVTELPPIFSRYLSVPDGRIFASALLGLIGIPIECLCWFAVYRMIQPYSEKDAHAFRAGIIGCLAFGGCGVHVPCCMAVYLIRHLYADDPAAAGVPGRTYTTAQKMLGLFPAVRPDLDTGDAAVRRPLHHQCSGNRLDQHRQPVDDGRTAHNNKKENQT